MSLIDEIVFIDPSISDADSFRQSLRPGVRPVILQPDESATRQMAVALAACHDLKAVHLVAHGEPGAVRFSGGSLMTETLAGQAGDLAAIGRALGRNGELLLWSCDTAYGEVGRAFLAALSRAAGAPVAASTRPVGATELGGSWTLDSGLHVSSERAPLTAAAQASYRGLMAIFTGTGSNDTADAITGALFGFTGGTLDELRDTIGDTFNALGSADIVRGGTGEDSISMGAGADIVIDFVGADNVDGGAGNDSLQLTTTSGDLNGASDSQLLNIEEVSAATILSGIGVDIDLQNQSEPLIITGSGFADTIRDGSANDTVRGGDGSDTIFDGLGDDNINGQAGNDLIVGFIGGAANIVNGGAGTGDQLALEATSADLNAAGDAQILGIEEINAAGAAAGTTINLSSQTEGFEITGSGFNDVITGGAGDDTISGGGGADTIDSGLGDDTVNGGVSGDIIIDGIGEDVLNGNGGNDIFRGFVGGLNNFINGGTDLNGIENDTLELVATSADLNNATFGQLINVENVSAATATASVDINLSNQVVDFVDAAIGFNLTGSGFADTLVGSAGNDTVAGGAGADVLTGGSGDDVINGGAGTDTAVFAGVWLNYSTRRIAPTGDIVVTDDRTGGDGEDLVRNNVESLQFANGIFGTLQALNDAPVANADFGFTTAEDTSLTLLPADLLINDTDADDPLGDVFAISSVQGAENGTVALGADGNVTFTPAPNYSGPAQFTYTVRDAHGAASTATVFLEIDAVPDASIIGGNITGSVTEDAAVDFVTGLLTVTDPDGPADEFFQSVTAATASNAGYGTYTLQFDGSWQYTLDNANLAVNALNTGQILTDTFTAVSGDGTTRDVTITIRGTTDASAPPTDIRWSGVTSSTTTPPLANVALANLTTADPDNPAGFSYSLQSGSSAGFAVSPQGTVSTQAAMATNTAYSLNVRSTDATGSLFDETFVLRTGSAAANVLLGAPGDDVFYALAGNDTLKGGAGDDTLDGGNNTDQMDLSDATAGLNITLVQSVNAATLDLSAAGLGVDTYRNMEGIIGSSFDDVLTGSSTFDRFNGGAGNDTLTGNSGNDTLDGGAGADTLVGGAGNDAYGVDSLSDAVTEQAGGGTDTVQASITYNLSIDTAHVENLTLTGTAPLNGTGNTGNNIIRGNSGNNVLDAGTAGLDQLLGGLGNDTYFVSHTGVTVAEDSNAGRDTVLSAVTFSLNGGNVENLTLTGIANISGTGNSQANALIGNAGINTLNGLSGNDLLSGGAGNDILTGGSHADTFRFDTSLTSSGIDRITDFASGSDRIALDDGTFSAIGPLGNFTANDGRFFAAAGAAGGHDANDRIVYNTNSGGLFYDPDGSGAGAAVQIAILGVNTHPVLAATDFAVV